MMNYRLVVLCCWMVVVLETVVVFGQDGQGDGVGQRTIDDSGEAREIREYIENWRGIQTIPEGASGWIPREPANNQPSSLPLKRRRLRKRKKRPPVITLTDGSGDSITPSNIIRIEPAEVSDSFYVEENRQVSRVQAQEAFTLEQNRQEERLALLKDRFVQEENRFMVPKKRKRPNVNGEWDEDKNDSSMVYSRKEVPIQRQDSDELTILSNPGVEIRPPTAGFHSGSIQLQNGGEDISFYYGKPNPEEEKSQETPIPNETPKITDLKAILKQNGGLSLSEILQEKNLSLAELLMGNQNAIKALTGTPKTTSSTVTIDSSTESEERTKYQRLPPSVALKKNIINRRFEQYDDTRDTLSERELAEAQRKRANLLQKLNPNNKIATAVKDDLVNEPVPNRSMFVPSHPKLYTAVNYKPGLSDFPDSATESYSSTTKVDENPKTLKHVVNAKPILPITNAKLTKLGSKRIADNYSFPQTKEEVKEEYKNEEEEEENYPKLPIVPLKPYKINIKELFGLQGNEENQSEQKDEPFRMNIDLEGLIDKIATTSTEAPMTSSVPVHATTGQTQAYTEEGPKLQPFTAKEEILEILKDPKGREDLAKILEARNMTIQELIEQRERGSSQRHLADIFHNKTREPEPVDEPLEGQVSPDVFSSFPTFARKSKSLAREVELKNDTEPAPKNANFSFPSFKIEIPKQIPTVNLTNPLEQLYTDLFKIETQNTIEDIEERASFKENVIPQSSPDILIENDIQRIDDANGKSFSSVSNEELNVNVDEDSHMILKNIPPGMKSAILASLLIVGLSLLVFMTILMVFRWTQKKKTRLNYGDSLKPPLFEVKPKKIKTFVVETLGKTKMNYYKNQMQNISDSIWDKTTDRKLSF